MVCSHDEYQHTRPGSGSSHGGSVERQENCSIPSGSPTGKIQVVEEKWPGRGAAVFPARGLEMFCVLI